MVAGPTSREVWNDDLLIINLDDFVDVFKLAHSIISYASITR